MADKPKVTFTVASLEAEIGVVEPLVIGLTSSKIVTFPDIGAMPAEEAENFLDEIRQSPSSDFKALEKWLSPKDFQTYKDAKLSLRTHAHLMRKVGEYYESTLGTAGEGAASAS